MKSLTRSLNILDYATSLLLRHRFKNFGILLVFAVVIFLLTSMQLVNSALRKSADTVLTTVPDITVQQMSGGRQVPISADYNNGLENVFGIKKIRERIWGYYFDEKNGANYTVVGLAPSSVSEDLAKVLDWGKLPEAPGEVVVAAAVAESMQLGERRQFSLFRPDLTLQSFVMVGQFKKGTGIITDDFLFMSQSDAGELFAMERGQITDLLVDVANPAEIDTVAGKIADAIPGSRVLTKNQIEKTYDVVFSWRSGFGSICLLTSLFAFIILAWDRASGFSPDEQREMAILKVIGWQTADIMILRFWESAIIALMAFLIGYSAAWLHVTVFGAVLLKPVMLGWSVLKPSFAFYPPFLFADLLLISACSIIPYMVATIVPAWKSGMVRPDMVI